MVVFLLSQDGNLASDIDRGTFLFINGRYQISISFKVLSLQDSRLLPKANSMLNTTYLLAFDTSNLGKSHMFVE
jgi:hypothetical protein